MVHTVTIRPPRGDVCLPAADCGVAYGAHSADPYYFHFPSLPLPSRAVMPVIPAGRVKVSQGYGCRHLSTASMASVSLANRALSYPGYVCQPVRVWYSAYPAYRVFPVFSPSERIFSSSIFNPFRPCGLLCGIIAASLYWF